MTTRRAYLATVVFLTTALGGCEDPVGNAPQQRDMFVRQIVDMLVINDAISLDAAMVIRECEDDETRQCSTNIGECRTGLEECLEGLWSGSCSGSTDPVEEACDEKDNDCDGLTDEVWALGGTCKYDDERGFERTGRVYCNLDEADTNYGMPYCRPEIDCDVDEDGDGSGVCDDCDDGNALNFPGNPERCDNVDNDCDERIDEGFAVDEACQIGDGICRTGGTTLCAPNEVDIVCDGQPGEPEDEQCDNLDNDCDGVTDEGYNLAAICTNGVGGCSREGVIACNANGGSACLGESGMPQNETCNEIDDDCDGVVDNGLAVQEACVVGRGICLREGQNRCNPDGSGSVVCSVEAGAPAEAELCNALDDDCDGVVDEANPQGGDDCESGRPGRCGAGIVTCVEGGLICQPQAASIAEVCNGLDDDCDQNIDEVPGVGERCSAGAGLCETFGTQVCEINVGLVCSAQPGPPSGEVCNGQDDDCDGRSDEGNPGAGGACESGELGRCLIGSLDCVEGGLRCTRSADPIVEFCNNIDDDCDGQIDEVPGVGNDCAVGIGACRRVGQNVCSDGMGLVCSAQTGTAVGERCNRLDDDCDGRVDETFNLRQACTVGIGACETPGQMACSQDGLDVQCEGDPLLPDVEACDGLDNDCDASTDEGNPESGGQCDTGQDGVCSAGVRSCRNSQLACDRSAEPSEERCDGLDNDCDGQIDETYDLDSPCTVGTGACQTPGQLTCTVDGLDTFCVGEGGQVAAEICNGQDDDCDGQTDENNPESGGQCQTGQDGICSAGIRNCRNGGLVCDRLNNPVGEMCNGADDDCDGDIDNGFDLGAACAEGVGGCREVGVTICNQAQDGTSCGAESGVPQPERCDAQDNDCDTLTDEGFDIGIACSRGLGICLANGRIVCNANGNGLAACDAVPLAPLVSENCNALDDDCDGNLDEENPEGGAACPVNAPGICQVGIMNCSEGQLACVPNARPGDLPEICDGQDNDCDDAIDENNPGGGEVCVVPNALGACAGGTTQCAGGFVLCNADFAQAAETCDEIDNDCDGQTDETFLELGTACDSDDDQDLCANGVTTCNLDTGGTMCVGDAEIPETCNNRDDDCDGIIDNSFDKLTDVTNCGTCGRDCRDADPGNPGFEYPNATCSGGTCFQTFYVDEANGSNAIGEGTSDSPWRTLAHVLGADGLPESRRIDNSEYAARIYIMPGRYSTDQWLDRPQCDGNDDGDPSNDLCASHISPCENDGNPATIDRCIECICSPELVCAAGLCSMQASERESFPIHLQNKVQLVGLGNVDHIIFDGGEMDCFINENDPSCSVTRRPGGGRLMVGINIDDVEMRSRAQTCFTLGDPTCMDPNDADYAYLSVQPNWAARGSRNLLENLTLLRGGDGNEPALRVAVRQADIVAGVRSNLLLRGVKLSKIRASPGYPVALLYDSDIMFDRVLVERSEGRSSRALILLSRATALVDRSRFQNNDITDVGRGLIQASLSEVNVLNSTFSNNVGGGVHFHSEGHGSVYYSTFSGNTSYHIYVNQVAHTSVLIVNNIFHDPKETQHLYVAAQAEADSFIYNNVFSDDAACLTGREVLGTAERLNEKSWASDNLRLNPQLTNPSANNLVPRSTSPAIDGAVDLPVIEPSGPEPAAGPCGVGDPVATCCDHNDICVKDQKWNLVPAPICLESGSCAVDIEVDTDADGHPDWLEIIIAGFERSQNINYRPELDRTDTPSVYQPTYDIDGVSRPRGAARDIGAFEFIPPQN